MFRRSGLKLFAVYLYFSGILLKILVRLSVNKRLDHVSTSSCKGIIGGWGGVGWGVCTHTLPDKSGSLDKLH